MVEAGKASAELVIPAPELDPGTPDISRSPTDVSGDLPMARPSLPVIIGCRIKPGNDDIGETRVQRRWSDHRVSVDRRCVFG
jgi:hypothetical protein